MIYNSSHTRLMTRSKCLESLDWGDGGSILIWLPSLWCQFCRKILIVCEGKLELNCLCMYLQFCKDMFVCMKGGCHICSIYTSQWINILASVGPHIGGGGGKGGLGPRGERLSDPISLLSATRSSDSSRYKFQTVNHTTLHFKVYLSFPLP